MNNVRGMIKNMQVEIRDTDLQPERAAELLTKLSALMGNCNDYIRKADVNYNLILLKWLEVEGKANMARIKAECSPEYLAKREARDTKELAIELVRSLKYFLRAKQEEWQAGSNI